MPKRGRGRPIIETLTAPQERLLTEIEAYIARHQIPPTLREVADQLGLGVANVCKLVQRMERNGYVRRTAGKARSLTVLRSANERTFTGLVAIPLLGTVAAGTPVFSPENVLGEVWVDAKNIGPGRHFALNVAGLSMIKAGIRPGDIVIARHQPLADHGNIVVALLNNEATVKRLHYLHGEVALLPENSRFKPIAVGSDDDLRIVGRVVDVLRKSGK